MPDITMVNQCIIYNQLYSIFMNEFCLGHIETIHPNYDNPLPFNLDLLAPYSNNLLLFDRI